MPTAGPTSWWDISSSFLQFSLEQQRLFPVPQALKAIKLKAGQTLQASNSFFFRIGPKCEQLLEIYTSETETSLLFKAIIKGCQKDVISFKKLLKSEKKSGFEKLNHLLIVPIEVNSYAVFGFPLSPGSKEKTRNWSN
ncbi:hypothetical protein [Litoribacter populi]|uniref:hypothetical protein n=1 Tax=Litoribacter populi TaxID=2598460 RepID=UPI00117F24A3|nr:hypothetical protein [Litoribacter populi]